MKARKTKAQSSKQNSKSAGKKNLEIHKETVSHLSDDELDAAKGGARVAAKSDVVCTASGVCICESELCIRRR